MLRLVGDTVYDSDSCFNITGGLLMDLATGGKFFIAANSFIFGKKVGWRRKEKNDSFRGRTPSLGFNPGGTSHAKM